MRIALDEGVPVRLARLLREQRHDAVAFPDDWKGLNDRAVLDRAEDDGFAILITGDKNMPFQQPLRARRLAVLILPDIDRRIVAALSGEIAAFCETLRPGCYHVLGRPEPLPAEPRKPL